MAQNNRRQNQAAPTYAKAAPRLDALNAKIAAAGGQATKKQQQAVNTLQNRVGMAQNQTTPATVPGLQQGQQNIAAAGTDIALNHLQSGQFQNPYAAPVTPDRLAQGDLTALRDNVYNEQYGYLTRDLGQQEAQAGQDVQQQLADRGITYSNDPNSQYQQQMKDYTNRFDRARLDARSQATQLAGQEMQRSFGMNEQQIANILSQGMDTRNQQMGELGAFSQLGQTGVFGYNQLQDVDLQRKQQKALEMAALNRQGGGGGSGGGSTSVPIQGAGAFEGI